MTPLLSTLRSHSPPEFRCPGSDRQLLVPEPLNPALTGRSNKSVILYGAGRHQAHAADRAKLVSALHRTAAGDGSGLKILSLPSPRRNYMGFASISVETGKRRRMF